MPLSDETSGYLLARIIATGEIMRVKSVSALLQDGPIDKPTMRVFSLEEIEFVLSLEEISRDFDGNEISTSDPSLEAKQDSGHGWEIQALAMVIICAVLIAIVKSWDKWGDAISQWWGE